MKKSICKPDYDRSILSISSSIMKNYGIESEYKSLIELDDILKNNYKNVIFLIIDGLGTEILKKNLPNNSFLRKNVITSITSVFPSTTAAATIALHSGKSPLENGWIGWMPYFKEYNRMIELFSGKDFYTREKIMEKPENGCLKYQTIYEKICELNKEIKYHKIFPSRIVENGATTFEDLCEKIEESCNNKSKNLISAYWHEPDHTIHHNGTDSKIVKNVLKNIDENIKKLKNNLLESIIIITADHGATDAEEVYINEIKEIDECLALPPSIESRFVSFFIKKGMKTKFKNAIRKNFKNKYILYTKKQFLKEGLLGRGTPHKRIDEYLGDYILICNSNLNILYSISGEKDSKHLADHGGITKEEMMVPLIVVTCNKDS